MKQLLLAAICLMSISFQGFSQRVMEKLDRGLVVVNKSSTSAFASWRMFGTDPDDVTFDLYRNGNKVNTSPIATSTNLEFTISGGSASDKYQIVAHYNGATQDSSAVVNPWTSSAKDNINNVAYYLKIPITPPAGGTTPAGEAYTYSANDASVGDLDGDGQYEIVLKWSPSNSKDNSQSGYTGNTIFEGLEFDGTSLWRIDLGINIRAGSHYSPFMVYDLDGDGIAEVACKTADGTKDATGKIIGDGSADFRTGTGYILSGPEYLTIFSGQTGAELVTTDYHPARGNVSLWGDAYGNRVDRFLATIAYLDGQRPSLVMCRGYYTRTVLAAYDYRGGELSTRWIFDSDNGKQEYMGQGAHSISVGDVDMDGKDEIMYGAAAIDDDGSGLYTTGMGHGDATHLADIDPDEAGLEFFMPHESSLGTEARPNFSVRNAATGEMQWVRAGGGGDIGRGMTMDLDANHRGYEVWSSDGSGVFDKDGNLITTIYPQNTSGGSSPSYNFGLWWDADLTREILDRGVLNNWNPSNFGSARMLSLYSIEGATNNNGTKENPCLSGDLIGDWREEILMRNPESTALIFFVNTDVTTHKIRTLMHDPQYRLAIAWQNVGYNQPPHPSFYLGEGMSPPPAPNITYPNACVAELKVLPFGLHTAADLAATNVDLSDISNLDLPLGSSLMLFENDNFQGNAAVVRGTGNCGNSQPAGTFKSAIFSSGLFDASLTYAIRSKANDKLLTVKDASKQKGAVVIITDDEKSNDVAGTNQVWSVDKDGGNYLLKGFQSRTLVEVDGSSKLVLSGSTPTADDSQEFEIILKSGDERYFVIKSVNKNQCLSLNAADGSLSCQTCNESDNNQLFYEQYRYADRVCQNLDFGQHAYSDLSAAGIDPADITDLELPLGSTFYLFNEDDFEGDYQIIRGSGCGNVSQPAGTYLSAIFTPDMLGENIHYVLKSKYLNRVITLTEASVSEGAIVELATDEKGSNDTNGANQVWTLEKTESGTFLIRSLYSKSLIDVNTDGTILQGSFAHKGESQEFEIVEYAPDKRYFQLLNKSNGKCMSGARDVLTCEECNATDTKQLFSEVIRWTERIVLSNGTSTLETAVIYPNPVESYLFIQNIDANKVELFTLTGQTVFSEEINGNAELDLSAIQRGTYILRIHSKGEVYSSKIFKK